MLKLLGAMLILVVCAYAGRLGAARLEFRCRLLLGAGQGILMLAKEIDYLATPLAEALRRAGAEAGAAGSLFIAAARVLDERDGVSGGEAWLYALDRESARWPEADKAALSVIAAGLGQMDNAGQQRHLELARLRVAEREREAAEQLARYGKIWRSMGWATGMVIVLLLV